MTASEEPGPLPESLSDEEFRSRLGFCLDTMEESVRKIRDLEREILGLRRSVFLLKKEREQMRSLLLSLEKRLQSISGKKASSGRGENEP